jgi:hypothetical protein
MACDGKLLMDRGSGSSTAQDGGVDAGAGGSKPRLAISGGSTGESGGSGGRTGQMETGGAVNAAGGAVNAAGGAVNAADGAVNTGGTFPQGSGGTIPVGAGGAFIYPDCPGLPSYGVGGIGVGGNMLYLLPATKSHWNGNAADCPSSAPESGSACTAADGEICTYDPSSMHPADAGPPGWYFCVAKDATQNFWVNIDTNEEYVSTPTTCPAVQPAEGQSCTTPSDVTMGCGYPGAACYCGQDGKATWHCIDGSPKKPAALPTALDPSKRVVDLTEDDRQAWCEWYDCNIVYSRYVPQVEGDHTVDPACAASDNLFENGTWAQLPLNLCMGNLRISTCEAKLQDLTDCLSTFRQDWPIGAGCARYFATPGCSGTIAVANDENYKGGRGGASGSGPGLAIDCSVRFQ